MSNEGWDVANRVLTRLRANMPVWFRREGFSRSGNYQSVPMWHRVKEVKIPQKSANDTSKGEKAIPNTKLFTYTYVAVCGYRFGFDALLGIKPAVKNEVKTKKLRCAKCDAKLATS